MATLLFRCSATVNKGHRQHARKAVFAGVILVIKAADEVRDKTTTINQLWQTDVTDRKVIGIGFVGDV